MRTCPDCDGKGAVTNGADQPQACFLCDGTGKVAAPRCPHCDGIGFVRPETPKVWPVCDHCDGSGEVTCG